MRCDAPVEILKLGHWLKSLEVFGKESDIGSHKCGDAFYSMAKCLQ